MLGPLILLMTLIPFLEIYFLLNIGQTIGAANTFAIIIFTGVLGAIFLKRQGAAVLRDVQSQMGRNQVPAEAMIKGVFTFLGGVLLLTPGFLTDALGFSLLFPVTQYFWRRFFESRIRSGIASGNIHVVSPFGDRGPSPYGDSGAPRPRRPRNDGVIDVQATSKKSEPVD